MITTGVVEELPTGMFSLMLEPCSAVVLRYVLSEDVPYVWIEQHYAHDVFEWWKTFMPLRKDGTYHLLEVRLPIFDIQCGTKEFLTLLPEFSEAGIRLFQMQKRWPASLQPRYLPEEVRYKILVHNGLYLEFILPHQNEYAQIVSPHREVLERINNHPVIASGDLP